MYDPYGASNGGSGASDLQSKAAASASTSGILSVPVVNREPPMFALSRMNIKLNQDIEQLVVSNHTMVVLMANVLHRIQLRATGDPIERLPELPMGVRITRMFLDPQGNHLLLTVRLSAAVAASTATGAQLLATSTQSAGGGGGTSTHELWYLHRTSREPKRCERYRGHEITAVGWNRAAGADAMTGAILLGTSRGVIFETELSCMPGERRGGASVNWKQLPNYLPLYGSRDVDGVVFDIGKGENCPITGLDFHKVPNTGRHIVMVTTLHRLYTFHEDLRVEERHPYLHNIFTSYLNRPEQETHYVANHLPCYSALRFIYDTPTSNYPRHYGWLTSEGITVGEIDAKAETHGFLCNRQTIAFPTSGPQFGDAPAPPTSPPSAASAASTTTAQYPIAFELTDYHIVLLYVDRIATISRLTHGLIFTERLDAAAGLVALARDQRAGTAYLCSRKEIMRLRVRDEQRNVWRQYLDKGDFVMAQMSTRNAVHLNLILIAEADLCFVSGEPQRAAQLYAESRACFETVCLKFLRDEQQRLPDEAGADEADATAATQREALMLFVRLRLEKMKATDITQITMLVVWLVQMYAAEITAADGDQRRARLRGELNALLSLARVKECVRNHFEVFKGLLASHGDSVGLNNLTLATNDYATLIEGHLMDGECAAALEVLRSHGNAIAPDAIYKYAPILMQDLPKETCEVLRAQSARLDPERLLPALVGLETPTHRTESMRYLEWCVHKMSCESQVLHNFLIQLYAQFRPERLMNYLNNEGADPQLVHYDVQFALRVCNKHACNEASVFLYCLLELWHPAVELALTVNVQLAEQKAVLSADPAVRRQLWLRIAEYRIRGQQNVRDALQVLTKCDGLLRIEDVLPFFSDFDRIDQFKEAVIDALREYNEEVQRYREEMDESARAAELVRDELQAFRQRSVRIGAHELCAVCKTLLMQQPFFVFQCGHMFHADCMEAKMAQQMLPAQRDQLTALHDRMAADPVLPENGIVSDRDRARAEYEELISAECLFCGSYMIESIDRPFGAVAASGDRRLAIADGIDDDWS